jgi:L-asparaginase
VTTRTGSGGVPIERADGMIGAGDLNAQKARVLLTLALSRTSDPAEVARIFESQQ